MLCPTKTNLSSLDSNAFKSSHTFSMVNCSVLPMGEHPHPRKSTAIEAVDKSDWMFFQVSELESRPCKNTVVSWDEDGNRPSDATLEREIMLLFSSGMEKSPFLEQRALVILGDRGREAVEIRVVNGGTKMLTKTAPLWAAGIPVRIRKDTWRVLLSSRAVFGFFEHFQRVSLL